MKIGDPLDRSTAHGPQNHRAHLEKLIEYVETGVKEGATCVYGGKQVDRPGMLPFLKGIFRDLLVIPVPHFCDIGRLMFSKKTLMSSWLH